MSKIWYIRHGESVRNVEGVFTGGKENSPLTEKGREQAKKAGELLKGEQVDFIVTSPLDRTKDTAEIIADELGFGKSMIQIDPDLLEYDIGAGVGASKDTMTSEKIISFEGAEDPYEFHARVLRMLQKIKELSEKGSVLVVGHGAFARMIEVLRLGNDPRKFFDLPGYPNAQPVELDLGWLK